MGVPTAKNHETNSTHLSIFELHRPVPSEDENKSGRFELRPLAIIGYALSIAWMTVLTWNPAVLLPHMASDGQIHILQGSLFAAVAMFSLVSIPLATLFSSERGCTILSVCTLTALVTAICCLSKPFVPWVCAGIVCFCLVLLWGRLFALLKRKSLLITASCAFMLAGILFVFIFALPSQAARLMTLSLPVLSLVLFHLTWKSQATGLLALHAADELSHIDKHPVHFDTAVSATCNLTMGFITAIASSQYFNQPISLFGGMTVVVAGIVSLGCLFKTARNPAYYFARLFPLCAAVLLTVVGVGGSLLGGIASILLIVVLCLADIINTCNVSKSAGNSFSDYARIFTWDLGLSRLAYLAGWTGGTFVLVSLSLEEGLAKPCLVVLALVSMGFSLSNYFGIDRHTFVTHSSIGSQNPFDTRLNTEKSPLPTAHPLDDDRKKNSFDLSGDLSSASENSEIGPRFSIDVPHEQAALHIIERYQLSRREAETLAYLVRGRNATHIAQKMFVSPNTVKSHMKRIYSKLGVHSQQELIDFVENYPEDETQLAR